MTEAERARYAGRDEAILNQHVEATIAEDSLSWPLQIENHLAHVTMLGEQGIISPGDTAKILSALLQVREKGPDCVGRRPGLTDLYSNLEEWLIDEVGLEVGGKMHTGRSRNDMNLTIERMYLRQCLLELCDALSYLMDTLLRQAEEHKQTIIPGYTHHSQHAQPVTLGHFYMAAFSNFTRDMERLLAAYRHTNLCPMGGAAIATTGFPLDRQRVSDLLGFREVIVNSMDATSSLDFAYETATAACTFIQNVGRVTESLLLWNMGEVGLTRLDLKYCSYSTIMPQKRNPVALETLRQAGQWSYGLLGVMYNTMKAYTPGNGREPGFVVGQAMEICHRITGAAYLLEGIVRTLEVDRARGLELTRKGFSTMTDLADELVREKGLSFSAAKKLVGRLVVIAHDEQIPCEQVDAALVQRAALETLHLELEVPDELVRSALDPVQNVQRRSVLGGPSPAQVEAMIADGVRRLEELNAAWRGERDALAQTRADLERQARALAEEG